MAVPLKDAGDLTCAARQGAGSDAARSQADVVGNRQRPTTSYMIDRMRGAAHPPEARRQRRGRDSRSKAAFNTGKVPERRGAAKLAEVDRLRAIRRSQANAKAAAVAEQGQGRERAATTRPAVRQLQAYLQGSSGDYATIARDSAANVQAAEAAGRRPGEDDLLRLADAYRHTGNKAGDMTVKEKLVTYYPSNKQYVGIYLSDLPGKSGFSSRFALDVMRLRTASGNADERRPTTWS